MLEHGGRLRDAAQRYQRPLAQWMDLSTGINPHAWPAPPLPPSVWHRLPEPDPALIQAARAYYQAPYLLPVAGTQAAIQALPRLRPRCKVLIAGPTYAEHPHAWRAAGHEVIELAHDAVEDALADADVLVVCNPNNPTGAVIAPQTLLAWHDNLARRGGWLVVDEAFGDVAPALSVAHAADRTGLIVLRSVGKFFGLAGLRLGFVAAAEELLGALASLLGPWTVSSAAQIIGREALADTAWQQMMRARLDVQGVRLHALLLQHGMTASGTRLFQWWPEPRPEALRDHMALRGIWVRCFTEGARGVRLGLPTDEDGWDRLAQALAEWRGEPA